MYRLLPFIGKLLNVHFAGIWKWWILVSSSSEPEVSYNYSYRSAFPEALTAVSQSRCRQRVDRNVRIWKMLEYEISYGTSHQSGASSALGDYTQWIQRTMCIHCYTARWLEWIDEKIAGGVGTEGCCSSTVPISLLPHLLKLNSCC